MADQMKATPRSPILGLFSDLVNLPLQYMSSPERTQQMQGTAEFLYGTGIPKTLERISYGDSLFSGSGGLGGTTRMRPETAEALMTVALMVKPAAVMANQAAMTAGRAGARYAERVVPQVMERGGLPAQLLGDVSRGSVRPLDVYHGTPHTLPPTPRNPLGEFDASKIGTGEGAQAYGYGIYTAENPAVATEYKLAEATYKRMQGGLTNKQEFVSDMLSQGRPEMSILDLYAQKYGGSFDDAMKDLIDVKEIYKKSGNLYKVDLPDEKIATMLDWDAPLSKQPDAVQRWLKDAYNPYKSQLTAKDVGGNEPTGSLIYNRLQELMSEGKKSDAFNNQANFGVVNASKELADFGIAGIKYFDEGSRAAGQGTRNFVVFPNEEKSMTILERNGMPATQIESPAFTDPFANTIGSSIR